MVSGSAAVAIQGASCIGRLTIPSRGTAHKLRLWVPLAASPLRRLLTSSVRRQGENSP